MSVLLYLTFFFFSFGQLGRVSFFNQQINFYLYEVLMGVTLIYCFKSLNFSFIKKSLIKLKLIYLFFGYLIFSFFINWVDFNLRENVIAFLYLSRLILYFLYFLSLFYYLKINHWKSQIIISRGLMIFIIITAITSLLQFFLYPSLYNLRYLGWDVHTNRLFGVFFDTSITGGVLGLIFFFLFLFSFLKNKLYLPLLFLYFILIILTYSRATYISFLLTMFFYFLKKKLWRYFIPLILVFIIFLILLPQRSGPGVGLFRFFSIEARLNENLTGLKVGLKNPIFGVGYNRIRYFKEKLNLLPKNEFNIYHSAFSFQSSFLTIFVASGIIGLVLFILVIIQLMKFSSLMNWSIVFISLASMADNLLLHPFIVFLLGNFLLLSNFSHKKQ